ncbi:Imm52 family immunity protein [Haliangium sp.]|uniref:Imm52 family immunity protein n=1 Tax=Haliangium sp. TaxID=2663208 RepID=UPI003D0B815A
MIESLTAAAYWGKRRESIEACTERLVRFLGLLTRVAPPLSHWYEKGWTKREATERPVVTEPARLRRLLQAGRNRDDTPQRRVLDDLGFRVGMWTGEMANGESASLSIHCGACSEHGGSNNVLLDFPADWLDTEQAVALVRAMVSCWSPVTAAVCTDDALLATVEAHDIDVPVIDWVFFHRRPRQGQLRAPSRVAFELDGGECIVVQDTPVRPDHVHERARVRELAKQLGLPAAPKPG